jgi:hypothetical protein
METRAVVPRDRIACIMQVFLMDEEWVSGKVPLHGVVSGLTEPTEVAQEDTAAPMATG